MVCYVEVLLSLSSSDRSIQIFPTSIVSKIFGVLKMSRWLIPSELSIHIFTYLDASELLNISIISKSWYEQSSSNTCWKSLILKLWRDKVYIASRIRQLADIATKLAFYISIADSKRNFMTQEEMSYFTFSFRFKEAAGVEWTDICPWNNGEVASKVLFHSDGSAQRVPSNRPDSLVHMAHESMYAGFRMNWVLRRRQRSLRKGSAFQYFYALNRLIDTYLTQNDITQQTSGSSVLLGNREYATGGDDIKILPPKAKLPRTSTTSEVSTGTTNGTDFRSRSGSNWFSTFSEIINSSARPPDSYLNSVGENLQLLVSSVLYCLYEHIYICNLI